MRKFLTLLAAAALVAPLWAQTEKLDRRPLSLGSADFPQLWAMNAAPRWASRFLPSDPRIIKDGAKIRLQVISDEFKKPAASKP